MMKNGNNKTVMIIALLVAVAALSIGFAVLSTALTINGTGTVKASNWDVHFEGLTEVSLHKDAKLITSPTLNATNISDYSVEFNSPGDAISFGVSVVNAGSYAAKLSSGTIGTPVCTGTGSTAEIDAKNVCDNLVYKVYVVHNGRTYDFSNFLNSSLQIASGDSWHFIVQLTYNSGVTAEQLPKGDVVISNLGVSMNFVQA